MKTTPPTFSSCALICLSMLLYASQHSCLATTLSRTCLSCEGINCQRTTRNQTVQCLDPLDYCVTIFDKVNVIRQGCSSEVPIELRRHCDANLPTCRKCFGNACNYWGPESVLCLQCDSAQDSNCATNMNALTPQPCAAATAMNSYCFVRYSSSGRASMTTQRGCAVHTDDQMDCFNSANCALCLPSDGSGCNNFNFTPNSRYRSL